MYIASNNSESDQFRHIASRPRDEESEVLMKMLRFQIIAAYVKITKKINGSGIPFTYQSDKLLYIFLLTQISYDRNPGQGLGNG